MPAAIKYQQDDSRIQNPAVGAFSITPHATNELTYVTKAIHANVDGDAALVFVDGTEATLTLAKGIMYPYQVKQVKASGTTFTAGQLIGLV